MMTTSRSWFPVWQRSVWGATFVALPRHRRLVGGLLAAFFGANIAQYVEGNDGFGLDTGTKRLVRLFFQPVLVLWALYGGGYLARRRAGD